MFGGAVARSAAELSARAAVAIEAAFVVVLFCLLGDLLRGFADHAPSVAPETVTASIGLVGAAITDGEASVFLLLGSFANHAPTVAPEAIAAAISLVSAAIADSEARVFLLLRGFANHAPSVAPKTFAAAIGLVGAAVANSEAGFSLGIGGSSQDSGNSE